jgi:uncharacterized protein (DUF488 family)
LLPGFWSRIERWRGIPAELERDAADRSAAIMRAEAVPWRCHRRLIADTLAAPGCRVLDIIGPRMAEPHQLTGFARVAEGKITYPAEPLFRPSDSD